MMGDLCLSLLQEGLECLAALGAGVVLVLDHPLVKALVVKHVLAGQLDCVAHYVMEAHCAGPVMEICQLVLGDFWQVFEVGQGATDFSVFSA